MDLITPRPKPSLRHTLRMIPYTFIDHMPHWALNYFLLTLNNFNIYVELILILVINGYRMVINLLFSDLITVRNTCISIQHRIIVFWYNVMDKNGMILFAITFHVLQNVKSWNRKMNHNIIFKTYQQNRNTRPSKTQGCLFSFLKTSTTLSSLVVLI